MKTNYRALFTAVCCFVLSSLPLAAQEPAQEKSAARRDRSPAAQTAPAKGTIAIVGGDVYTVTHEVIARGTVLIKDGKILKVGQDVVVPKEAIVLDAKGKIVTPGFVAIDMEGVAVQSQRGISRGAGGGRFADSLDPLDRNIKFCLGVGITTGCVQSSGGSGGRSRRGDAEVDELSVSDTQLCPCCNLPILPTEPITPPVPSARGPREHAVLKMTYGDLDSLLVKESPFYSLPSSALSGSMNRFNWRENLRKAKQYLKELAEYEKQVRAGNTPRPPRKPVSDELIALAKKEIALRTEASSADRIRDMIALAKELDYRLVLEDAHEAWLATDDLSQAHVPVVLTPRDRRRPNPGRDDISGSSIETSGVLERAGVAFAVATLGKSVSLNGLPGRDLTSLPLEAAFAVRGGCSERVALAALTIIPAQILGLADRIGSIEEGKDADLLILDGPPLDYRTYVETALVGGKVYYQRCTDRVYPVFERSGR